MDDTRFENDLGEALRRRAAMADALFDPHSIQAAVMHQGRRGNRRAWARLGLAGAALAVIVLAAVSIGLNFISRDAGGRGMPAATSCDSARWPSTPITCEAAEAEVSWGTTRIDQTRIWLTTLEAVKATLNPRRQIVEPPASTPVWLFVYDGLWTCCLVGEPDGTLSGPNDYSRWIYVADATGPGKGFIYIQDWSGRSVPERMPALSLSPTPTNSSPTIRPLGSGEMALVTQPPVFAPPGVPVVCGGVGLDAVLRADPTDPRLVWLENRLPGYVGARIEAVWPPGYRVRFVPTAEVLDGSGLVMLREGDSVLGACGVGPEGAYLQPPFK
jgi:hypothetical protein